MDSQTDQNLRARGTPESGLRALVYALATALMVGAIMFSGATPGVRWGVFLIACALAVAARNTAGDTGRTRGAKGAALSAADVRR